MTFLVPDLTCPDLPEMNSLARPWGLDLGLPDFAAVRHEDVEPAVRAGMALQRAQWEAVATDPHEPTLANTIEPLERSGELLDRATTVLYSLTSATHCPDLDEVEERLAPELAAHHDAYSLDTRLYRRLKALDELVREAGAEGTRPTDADGALIDSETARLIRLGVEELERGGIALEGAQAQRLREINARLTTLSTRAGSLIAEAMHASGGASYTAAPALATTVPHAARTQVLERSMSRGLDGEHDLRPTLLEEVALRAERARLLGFEHHAALVAAESAARSTQAVSQMLSRLAPPAMDNARRDAQVLATRMSADPQTLPGETFGPQDWPFYEAAEQRERFGVNDEVLSPYLELSNVVEKGVFMAANRLYGITFHERADLSEHMYAPEVRVWEVHEEDGEILGLFVGDYHARAGKEGGAWMDHLVDQSHLTGNKPVVINCLNVAKPESGPVLLTWDEVVTAFHEFGHALHGLFSDTRWPSTSGTSVPRDVVEFPSQVNEGWALHPEVLASYARHAVTGDPLPTELATRLRSQGSFGQGYATAEYLGAALLDQAWHTLTPQEVPTEVEAVEDFEHAALAAAGIDDALVPPRYRSTYFNHVFSGGYSAAYYAYVWSEVMDADATRWFRTDGQGGIEGDLGLNRVAGERFRREVLSRGDSRAPIESYQALTGRLPRIAPLLERRGLA